MIRQPFDFLLRTAGWKMSLLNLEKQRINQDAERVVVNLARIITSYQTFNLFKQTKKPPLKLDWFIVDIKAFLC